MRRSILLAVKPRFADAIYARAKLYEYRRVRAKFRPGDYVFVYESHPKKCVSGQFEIGEVSIG
jgi:predicted transcriptional regulator